MRSVFSVTAFHFPYDYKFPGQNSDEKILFVGRENKVMLQVRRFGVVVAALVTFGAGLVLQSFLEHFMHTSLLILLTILFALLILVIGWWWVSTLWMKSLYLVTTRRLSKFIYTTPFNRHNLSLPLDHIVDTGSYTRGFSQAAFKLGTFTARSAAASSGLASEEGSSGEGKRVNKKYFYLENIAYAEDLQHYVGKLLYAYRQHHDKLSSFRPFIPNLKGEQRKKFMEQYPEYWS